VPITFGIFLGVLMAHAVRDFATSLVVAAVLAFVLSRSAE
jgi:hypothetical protein